MPLYDRPVCPFFKQGRKIPSLLSEIGFACRSKYHWHTPVKSACPGKRGRRFEMRSIASPFRSAWLTPYRVREWARKYPSVPSPRGRAHHNTHNPPGSRHIHSPIGKPTAENLPLGVVYGLYILILCNPRCCKDCV